MVRIDGDVIDPYPDKTETNEVIRLFRQEITAGLHWYLALLNAIGRWEMTEETIGDRTWQYLIAEEAFDILVLAERLCQAVQDLLPEKEMQDMLFGNGIPLDVPQDEFKSRIGEIKYHQFLNFYYGVTVEEALQITIEEEIRKERRNQGLYRYKNNVNEVFQRIYGYGQTVMLKRFRKEKGYSLLKSIKLNELKEFTYWLFKHRLKQSDKARVASDTKKGLDWLKNMSALRKTGTYHQPDTLDTPEILNR